MRATRFPVCLIVLGLSACASTPRTTTVDCAPRQAWERGLAGLSLDAGCTNDTYRQAALLARDMGDLLTERAELVDRLRTLPTDGVEQGQTRRRIRQLDIDIEAIRGVAQVRGLVDPVQTDATRANQKGYAE